MTTPMKDIKTSPFDTEVVVSLALVVVALIFAYVIQTILSSNYLDELSYPTVVAIGFGLFGIAKYLSLGKRLDMQMMYGLAVVVIMAIAVHYLNSDDVNTFWWAAFAMTAVLIIDAVVVIAAWWYKKFEISKELVLVNLAGTLALGIPLIIAMTS